jgi:hypothetical protein
LDLAININNRFQAIPKEKELNSITITLCPGFTYFHLHKKNPKEQFITSLQKHVKDEQFWVAKK